MKQQKGLRTTSLKRLFGLASPHKTQLFLGMVALVGGSSINLVLPEVLRRFLNNDNAGWLIRNSWNAAAILIALFAIQAFCFYFRSLLFGSVGQRVVCDLRKKLFAAIISRDLTFFDSQRSGDLVTRLSSDALLVQDAVSVRLSVLVRYSLQVVFGLLLMSFISFWLTLSIFIIVPLIVCTSIVLARRLKAYTREQQAALGASNTMAEEAFNGARIVKSFNREEWETNRYSMLMEKVFGIGLKRTNLSAFFQSFASLLMNCAIVIVLLLGLRFVSSGTLTVGDLSAFLMYGVIVAVSFSFVASAYSESVQSVGAAERIFEFIDEAEAHSSVLPGRPLDRRLSGGVDFRGVSFSYPSRQEKVVLDHLSFNIPAGKTTAIIGPSGSGKSTILNLMMRFYDPDSGEILVDSEPLRDISPESLREQIALVPQDSQLFGLTIAENLMYGMEDATIDELREACRRANILTFVESLPEQFDTHLGGRAVQISGGQRQRLAIARALLRDPAILILDEATSALDVENEHLVQEALSELMASRTSVVVAHRLSTIRKADHLIVIDQGKIIQQGSPAELLREEGLYRQIVEKQESGHSEVLLS